MFLSEILHSYYLNASEIRKLFFRLKYLNSSVTFQVYIDLCLFRKWKHVRILNHNFLKQYVIIAENPKKKKKNLELFLPINFDVKIMIEHFHAFRKRLYIPFFVNFNKKINLAFIDQDSTVVYYCLVFNIHKTSGPLI
jgi:hypothetical protein